MKPQPVTLSRSTLENTRSVEYQWVRVLYVSGYDEHQINQYIQQCFGGDARFANLFRKVALHQESLTNLLLHLGYPLPQAPHLATPRPAG